MSRCEKLEKCPFFNDKMDKMPSISSLMKQNFCEKNKENCARYMVASTGIAVPADLFPHNLDKAKSILEKNRI